MISVEGYVSLCGEHFSPTDAEKIAGIIFDEKKERGDIGIRGKYKDQPIPYGSASINFKDTSGGDYPDLLSADLPVLNILEKNIPSFRASGADEITLYVIVIYTAQCNFELSPALLRRLAVLGIPLCISTINEGQED